MDNIETMEGFADWFISRGGFLDKSAMILNDIPNQGRGAIALKDIPVRSSLVLSYCVLLSK